MLRILIAEDDASVLNLFATYARARGHEVLTALDGEEALRLARAERPDVLLLDVALPRRDGRDVCAQLKGDPRTAGLTILAITARGGDAQVRRDLLELGAHDVFEKPVVLHVLFDKAERLAGKASAGHAREGER